MKVKGTKTRNGNGIVKVKVCPICGRNYQVRRGKNHRDGTITIFDPHQCGGHIGEHALVV